MLLDVRKAASSIAAASKACWWLRQHDLPSSYLINYQNLGSVLRLNCDGILFFHHSEVGDLPLGHIYASHLVCFRSTIALWGEKRLRIVRRWWNEHYAFNDEQLPQLLRLDNGYKVSYRGHVIGWRHGGSLWFNRRSCVIYSNKQLGLICQQLEKRLHRPLVMVMQTT